MISDDLADDAIRVLEHNYPSHRGSKRSEPCGLPSNGRWDFNPLDTPS